MIISIERKFTYSKITKKNFFLILDIKNNFLYNLTNFTI